MKTKPTVHVQEISTETLDVLERAVATAQRHLKEALESKWPIGTTVQCMLSHRQKVPTGAQVTHHRSDGTLQVELPTCNRRGYRTRKNVHWKSILHSTP